MILQLINLYKDMITNYNINDSGKPCIYLRNMSRKDEIAFVDKVDYFGPGLIALIPKTVVDLDKTVKYLNSMQFKQHFIYSGRFKIGHRQLCKSVLFL